jgi:adenylylsulfate kinase-like enzyme
MNSQEPAENILNRKRVQEEKNQRTSRKGEGAVIWITGLSGVGKSTIAQEVVGLLREKEYPNLLLDGDQIRAAIADPNVGYDRVSRLINALRICRLAKLIAEQGIIVVVATMSLFQEVHEWNRGSLPNYFEVYVRVSLETLRRRNPNGLNQRRERGEAQHVVGMDLSYDEPKMADLLIENEGSKPSCREWARKILDEFGRKSGNCVGLYEIS